MRKRCLFVVMAIALLLSLPIFADQAPLVGTGFVFGFLSPYVDSTLLVGFVHDMQYYPLNLTVGVEGFMQLYWETLVEESDENTMMQSHISTEGYLGILRIGLRLINSQFIDFDAYGGASLYTLMFVGEQLSPVYGAGINIHTGCSSSIRVDVTAFCDWDDPEPDMLLVQAGLIFRY